MKSSTFTILACAGSVALGVGIALLFRGTPEVETHGLAPVTLIGKKSTATPEVMMDAVSAKDPDAVLAIDEPTLESDVAETPEQVAAPEPVLEVISYDQKVAKRSNHYVYRSWRVDIENHSKNNVDAYVEVEWLDADGFRVAYSNESRTVGPGVTLITDVEMLDQEESRRVHSFRVTEVKASSATETVLGFTGYKEKIAKRTKDYVYRAWRVDVVNNSDVPVDCFVAVEWLDADGHRVEYSNERRDVKPGVNVISDTEMFDCVENARVQAFRVIKLKGR